MNGKKVFGVGFQKTSTSSLGVALSRLGYNVGSYWDFRDMAGLDNLTWGDVVDRAVELSKKYDAMKDTPWPLLYREMDELYPGSKFILIIRDTDKWIASAVKDFASFPNSIHKLIYGVSFPAGNEQIWRNRYERHNREVQEYFCDRPDDLLVLHLDKGEVGWGPVCSFLGLDVPDEDWPHANKIADKKAMLLKSRIKRKFRKLFGINS